MDGGSDFFATYYVILTFVKDCHKGGVAGGVVVEKFHHLEM